MDKYFVQYYDDESWITLGPNDPKPRHFHNGFSAAYDHLKELGDFIWLPKNKGFPITSGDVYVSLMYKSDLRAIIESARDNSGMTVHVGGPLVSTSDIFKHGLPNVKSYPTKMVEEVFNIPYDPNNWGLDIPTSLLDGGAIAYNYGAISGTGCPWAKCTFCKCMKSTKNYKELERFTNGIPVVPYDGYKYIWIRSASLDPAFLDRLEPLDKVMYCAYTRGDWNAYKKLVSAPIHRGMLFSIGVELPSDRMLRYMIKGSTVESLIKTSNLLTNSGSRVHMNFILGWPNLKESDVDGVKNFLSRLKNKNEITATLYYLMTAPGRYMYDNPPGEMEKYDPYSGDLDLDVHVFKLDEQQRKLNDMLHKLYHYNLIVNSDKYELSWRRDG